MLLLLLTIALPCASLALSPLRFIRQLLHQRPPHQSSYTPKDCRSLDVRKYSEQQFFHHINLDYPGLRLINEAPFIFAVDDFLTEGECDALRAKYDAAANRARVQGMGEEEQENVRTSTGVVATDEELPAIRERIATLAKVQLRQMQPTKLSRYTSGQAFSAHSDAVTALYGADGSEVPYDGETDLFADGNRQVHGYGPGASVPGLNRFLTVLIYLNDCEEGGHTCWLWSRTVPGFHEAPRIVGAADFSDEPTPYELDLLVTPRRGMAVVHFPSTTLATGGLSDPNARHEGAPAVSTKYVAQTFIWNAPPNREGDFSFMDDENLPDGRLDEVTC